MTSPNVAWDISRVPLEADRQVANTLAELILGGALTSAEVMQHTQDDAPARRTARTAISQGSAGSCLLS